MKAAFHTLGCKVNQYETEIIKERFRAAGHEIAGEGEAADVYVVNTCTVTHLADRKSRQFIRRARKQNPDAVVAVTGCYAQLKPDEVAAIEGVEIVCGTDNKGKLVSLVEDYLEARSGKMAVKAFEELTDYEELGEIAGMEGRTRAFIKIQDGCNNFCTYCIIPYARGRIRSRDRGEIVSEVRGLVSKGYKEIVLTGINTAFYGREKGGEGIEPLIAELDAIPGDFRIRLSSLEPTVIDASYVKQLLKYEKLCHHLHLALQSGSDAILGAMKRGYTRSDFLEIVEVLRDADPNYGISTDIIVGFPGETEEDFAGSADIVETCDFCKVHVFRFSPREGTPAAVMDGQIDPETKAERSRRLIDISDKSAESFFRKCEGTVETALFERESVDPISGESQGKEGEGMPANAQSDVTDGTKLITGYTGNYIKVYMPGDESMLNRFVRVRLIRMFRDGMLAELVDIS